MAENSVNEENSSLTNEQIEYTLKSISDENSSLTSEQIEYALTSIYDVTKTIFKYLPLRSIDTCSTVCRSWYELAKLIKSRRHTFHTITYPSDINTGNFSNLSSGMLSDFDIFIDNTIQEHLWSVPCFALVLSTNILATKGFYSLPSSSTTTDTQQPPPKQRRLRSSTSATMTQRYDIDQALLKHLPQSCSCMFVVSEGIISSSKIPNQNTYYTNELESTDAIGILLMPKMTSSMFGVYPFQIPSDTNISNDMSRSDLHRFLGNVPNDVDIRCIIFFFIQRQSSAMDCLKKLLEFYHNRIAVTGGFVEKIWYDDRKIKSKQTSPCDACGIVFTGNNIRVGQIVLESFVTKKTDIKQKIEKLKYIMDGRRSLSFGLQVSCVGRGTNLHNDTNIECNIFRSLFPSTPLVGVFGNGELGHDYLPNYDDSNSTTNQNVAKTIKKETGKSFFRGYSSVFTLISIPY